jgi:hydrogenase small subunit
MEVYSMRKHDGEFHAIERSSNPDLNLMSKLEYRGVSRREFLKFCGLMATVLGLPVDQVPRIVRALETAKRQPAIYLEFQDCAGCTEAFLRCSHPTVTEIVLDLLALNYQETIMAAAGTQAEAAQKATIEAGNYLLLVEGSISTKDKGVYCCIGGRTSQDLLMEAASNAVAIVAVGNCACFGNIPRAYPDPTGAVGVRDLVQGLPIVNMAGCPVNAVNLAAIISHFLTYDSLPQLDGLGRPLFGYGTRIHDACERRAHFDAGEFVEEWGDEGHRAGWCLYKMGCKGPATFHNCPIVRYNERTNWPVGAGHGCIGCAEVKFWDRMTPFYERLPNVPGFGVEIDAEKVAYGVTAFTAASIGLHALGSALRKRSGKVPTEPVDRPEQTKEEEE